MENLEELLNDDNKRQELLNGLAEKGIKTFTEDKLNEYVSNVGSDQANELIKKAKLEGKNFKECSPIRVY